MSTPKTTTEMPNLGSIVTNPTARKIVYGIYGVAAIAVGGTSAYFVAVGGVESIPAELTGAQAVVAYAGLLVASLSLANTPTAGAVSLSELPVATVEFLDSPIEARIQASTESAPIAPLETQGRHEQYDPLVTLDDDSEAGQR